jgi:hypothetical protein
LYRAILDNDYDTAANVIKEGADPHASYGVSGPLINAAAQNRDPRFLALFIDAGVVPTGQTVYDAVAHGSPDVARTALEKSGLRPEAIVLEDGRTLAHAAGISGDPDTLNLVADTWRADMTAVDDRGDTAAHDLMIDMGSSVGMRGADERGLEMLRALADHGLNLNQANDAGERPIETLLSIANMDITRDSGSTLADEFPKIVEYMDSIGAGLDDGPVAQEVEPDSPPQPKDPVAARAAAGGWKFEVAPIACEGFDWSNVGAVYVRGAETPEALHRATVAMGLRDLVRQTGNTWHGGCQHESGPWVVAVPKRAFEVLVDMEARRAPGAPGTSGLEAAEAATGPLHIQFAGASTPRVTNTLAAARPPDQSPAPGVAWSPGG